MAKDKPLTFTDAPAPEVVEVAPAPVAPEPSGPVLPAAAQAVIESWFVANCHNRELPVQLFNSLMASKDSLKLELARALAGKD